MPTEKDTLIQFVVKLIELTQDGKISWYATQDNYGTSIVTKDLIYQTSTKYDDKRFRLYKTTYPILGTSGLFSKNEPDIYSYSIFLEIIDDAGNKLWTFPDVSGLSDLYEAVRYRVAGVKSIIDKVLGEKKDS